MIFNSAKRETVFILHDDVFFCNSAIAMTYTKVLFAYDFGMEQTGTFKPCYPDALTRFKLLTQTIQSTVPQLQRCNDKMKGTA